MIVRNSTPISNLLHIKHVHLLLCGGDKRSQQKDLETALQLAEAWRKS